ncbi:MAG TPA: hypothetical protein VK978_02695 [Candidatus Saccharimonadales bacterium]|nr:hypothetical protein [Candidatus Saccharimonadales bacterium]
MFRTDGDGVWLHTVPSVQDGLIVVLPEGAQIDVICWTLGEDVLGNPVWLYGTSGNYTGYVTDYYVNTSWNTTGDLTAQGIPQCGTEAPGSAEPQAPGVRLQLGADAGERERRLAALEPDLAAAATRVNIDGQTLARLIYHEGGEYLSWRQDLMKAQDRVGLRSSVGLAQVQIDTARLVDREIYGDVTMAESSDDAIRDRLIDDWPYAMRTAAGYVRLLQNRGMTGEWPLFMAYSIRIDTALAWKAMGHPMDKATLLSLGITKADSFIARQREFNEAVDAIG